jgi:hypothetical protein
LTDKKKAPYVLKQDGVDVMNNSIEIAGSARLISKRWGYTSVLNIVKNGKHFQEIIQLKKDTKTKLQDINAQLR